MISDNLTAQDEVNSSLVRTMKNVSNKPPLIKTTLPLNKAIICSSTKSTVLLDDIFQPHAKLNTSQILDDLALSESDADSPVKPLCRTPTKKSGGITHKPHKLFVTPKKNTGFSLPTPISPLGNTMSPTINRTQFPEAKPLSATKFLSSNIITRGPSTQPSPISNIVSSTVNIDSSKNVLKGDPSVNMNKGAIINLQSVSNFKGSAIVKKRKKRLSLKPSKKPMQIIVGGKSSCSSDGNESAGDNHTSRINLSTQNIDNTATLLKPLELKCMPVLGPRSIQKDMHENKEDINESVNTGSKESVITSSKEFVISSSKESVISSNKNSVETGSIDFVNTGSKESVDTGSKKSVYTGSKESVETGSKESVETGSKDSVYTGSKESVDTGSKESVDTVSKKSVYAGSKESVNTCSKESVDTDSKESVDTGSKESVYTGSKEYVDTGSKESVDTGSKESVDTGSKESVDTGNEESVDTGSKEYVDTGSKESVDAGSKESVDTGSKESVDAGSKESVDTGSKESVDTGSEEYVDTGSKDSVETGSKESVDTDSKEYVDTGSKEYVIISRKESVYTGSKETVIATCKDTFNTTCNESVSATCKISGYTDSKDDSTVKLKKKKRSRLGFGLASASPVICVQSQSNLK